MTFLQALPAVYRGVRRSEMRRAAEGAEQQQVQGVQACMQGLQATFQDVHASLQSLQASLHTQAPEQEAHKKVSLALCLTLLDMRVQQGQVERCQSRPCKSCSYIHTCIRFQRTTGTTRTSSCASPCSHPAHQTRQHSQQPRA